jgi:hypothetical protein
MDLATRNAKMLADAEAAAAHKAREIELSDREMTALKLYVARATWAQIASAVGLKTPSAARKFTMRALVKRATQIDSTPVSLARALMLDSYDMLIGAFLPQAVTTGDDKAAKVVTTALTQQARLLGLEAPKRHEHEHHLAEAPDQRVQREQKALESIRQFGDRTIEGETA